MSLCTAGHVTQLKTSGVTATTSAVTLKKNVLYLLPVENHHATPASLATPTVAMTGGGVTWTNLGSQTLSPSSVIRCLTLFCTMVETEVTDTILVSGNGISQTWTISLDWIGSADPEGALWGAGAIVQVKAVNNGNTSGTTATATFDADFSSANNCAYSVFVSSSTSATATARASWTELYDTGATATIGNLQTQWFGATDTDGSVTFSASGLTMGYVVEVKAVASPVVFGFGTYSGSSSTNHVMSLEMRVNELTFLLIDRTCATTVSDPVAITNGMGPWRLVARVNRPWSSTSGIVLVYALVPTATGTFTTTIYGVFANITSVQPIYASNVDYDRSDLGILQVKTGEDPTYTPSATLDALTSSRHSSMIACVIRLNESANSSVGWSDNFGGQAFAYSRGAILTRANSDEVFTAATSANYYDTVVVYMELLAAPGLGGRSCLTFTRVSPLTVGEIPSNSWLVIEVLDPDTAVVGGLGRLFIITAYYSDLPAEDVWNGVAFEPNFLGSYRIEVAGGHRLYVRPASAVWPPTTVRFRGREL